MANGIRADVEAVGDVSLELASGFTLLLRDVLYVPSLQRNLISVSRLDNDDYACRFGDGKCQIYCNNDCVGVAFQQDLYLSSLRETVNSVCDATENTSLRENANRKIKRTQDTSSKLLHCHIGHISRRRIERLVKNEILPPLEFSELEQCINCI